MFIDSHAHLEYPDFDADLDEVITRAKEGRVDKIINIGTTLESSRKSIHLSERYPDFIYPAAGFHPHDVDDSFSFEKAEKDLEELLKTKKTVAVGECGLDYSRLLDNAEKVVDEYEVKKQKDLFNLQLGLAKKYNLPVIIHSRTAEEDTFDILNNHNNLKGVVHCYTGTLEFAKKVLDLGFYIGFTGIITFPNAVELTDVVKNIPLEKMLIETDSPFIAPVPFRGNRNEPANVKEVAGKIAEIKNLSLEEVARQTSKNAEKLFVI